MAKENVMKSTLSTKRVMGFIFSLSLLLGIGVAASSQAHAQYRDPNWQRDQSRRQRDWEREQRRRDRQSDRDWRNRDDRNDRNDTAEQYNWGGSYQLRQTALNAGYNEGIKEGRTDRSRGERFEYRDESDFRSANKDYSSRLGSRELYAQYFRQGFANGYTDGYRGH
jgi:hypothetical protein